MITAELHDRNALPINMSEPILMDVLAAASVTAETNPRMMASAAASMDIAYRQRRLL